MQLKAKAKAKAEYLKVEEQEEERQYLYAWIRDVALAMLVSVQPYRLGSELARSSRFGSVVLSGCLCCADAPHLALHGILGLEAHLRLVVLKLWRTAVAACGGCALGGRTSPTKDDMG